MFTPPAQLNVFDFLFNRGGMPARSCLGARSVRIGEDSLNLLNRGDVIPLGFTPCNACPVEFPDLSGTPLGIQQGGRISLGLYCSKKRFSQKLH